MTVSQAIQEFITGMKQTGWVEYIAVFSGIISVWLSKKENILVYPVGLINTIFYVYLSFKGGLLGEASVNFYYTVMSVYGWYNWSRKDKQLQPVIHISYSSAKEKLQQLMFFTGIYVIIFYLLTKAKTNFAAGAIPWADAFASATAFTGMWLMTKKKMESWIWYMLTNLASIPLYFVKQYVFTSVYFVILLLLAVAGWTEWKSKESKVNRKR